MYSLASDHLAKNAWKALWSMAMLPTAKQGFVSRAMTKRGEWEGYHIHHIEKKSRG